MHAVLHAPAPVMLFDDTGRIVLLNQAWERSFGVTTEELRRTKDWTAGAPNADAAQQYFQRAIDTTATNTRGEFSFPTGDGKPRRWSLTTSALGPWGTGRRLFVCIATDVTASDQSRKQPSAGESERRYRQLLEAFPTAIYTTDASGRITFYNRAAATLWGHNPPLGSHWCGSWRLYSLDGQPMPHDQCPMAVALRENRPIRGVEAIAERPDGTMFTFAPYPTPLHDKSGKLIGAVNMLVDITGRKRAEKRLHVLAREVDHRTKNMLAIIQGLVRFTRADTVGEFSSAIEGRIMALARAHSLLSDSAWDGADLKELVEAELSPQRIGDATRVTIEGGNLILPPAIAQSLAMMLHELAINAVKHGSLSQERGRVTVRWTVDAEKTLTFRWQEAGLAALEPPSRRGFGLNLIERTAADQLDGDAQFEWSRTGLVCRLHIPMRAPVRSELADAPA